MTVNNPYFLRDLNIENLAIRLLSETLGDKIIPIDVIELAKFLDISIEFNSEKFTNNNDLGLTEFYSQNTAPKIFINANTFGKGFTEIIDTTLFNKCRFTIAHEIGHCYLPAHKNIQIQQTLQNVNNPHSYSYSRQKEREADEFASTLLIPEATVNKTYISNSDDFF